jgi:hypothetical protein
MLCYNCYHWLLYRFRSIFDDCVDLLWFYSMLVAVAVVASVLRLAAAAVVVPVVACN